VLEDGKPQRIDVFNAVDVPDVTRPRAAWMPRVTPDVTTNDRQETRLFILVMDDATPELNVGALASAKKIAHSVIDKLGPADLMSVVFTRDNRHAQDFTADRRKLIAAVDSFTVGFRGAGGPDTLWFQYSVNVLSEAANFLIALPERRKAIVYVGQGVPFDPNDLGPVMIAPGRSMAGHEATNSLKTDIDRLFARARTANVNIYTMDICGLRTPPPPNNPTCIPGLETDYLRGVAEATGGHATVDTNDFEPGIAEVFTENASYYLLGYRPATTAQDGKHHRIDVRVNRPDVDVRTRSGYDAPDASKMAKATGKGGAGTDLATAISGLLPAAEVPLEITLAPFATPDRKSANVAMVLGVRQPVPEATKADRVTETVELQTSVFTIEGASRGSARQTAKVVLRPGATGQVHYELLAHVDLKPGRYTLRVAASSQSSRKTGSVYADLDVPDFDAPLALSGIVLSKTPALASAPKDALAKLLPVVPTSERQFLSSDRIAVFARIYTSGKSVDPVRLATRIRDARDAVVYDQPGEVAPGAFSASTHAADFRLALPIDTLGPGPHVLTLDASLGKDHVERSVVFHVR
jgi:VWFA-related protein